MTIHVEQSPIQAKKKKGLSKKTIDIIRTTQRNNIDLTAIADNKANVLLSLNAIMITCLVPVVFAYYEQVVARLLFVPLGVLATTCFTTIYLAAQVLKPANFDSFKISLDGKDDFSPFFFGNFYQMEPKEYHQHFKTSLSDPSLIKEHLAQDLYYLGKRLGIKMGLIRQAFNIFIIGIFLTLLSMVVVLSLF